MRRLCLLSALASKGWNKHGWKDQKNEKHIVQRGFINFFLFLWILCCISNQQRICNFLTIIIIYDRVGSVASKYRINYPFLVFFTCRIKKAVIFINEFKQITSINQPVLNVLLLSINQWTQGTFLAKTCYTPLFQWKLFFFFFIVWLQP